MTPRDLANQAYLLTHPIHWTLEGDRLTSPTIPGDEEYQVEIYPGPLGPWFPCVAILPALRFPEPVFQSLNPFGWPSDLLRFAMAEAQVKITEKQDWMVKAILFRRKDKP